MRILVVLCMLFTAPANADEPNQDLARAHYVTGRSYYDQGRYAEALREFQEAYRLSERLGFLYNIGVCYQQLNQPKPAIDAFERYLAATPNGSDRAEVQARIDHLRASEVVVVKPAPPPPPEKKPVYKRGWFWGVMAGVAVVVAGGVATGVVLGTRSSGPRTLSDVFVQ